MGSPRRASLSARVPTWCVKPCLELCVEEVPDDAPVVFILCQPAAAGKGHALPKRRSVHLYPVYKPAWGLACRWTQRDTESIKSLCRYGFLGMSSEAPSFLPCPSSQSSTSLVAPFTDSVVKTTLSKMCTWRKPHPIPSWTSVSRRAAAEDGSCHCWSWRSTERR